MISYEEALKNYNKAKEANDKTALILRRAERDLESSKKELEAECDNCHKLTKIKDIELIIQYSNGWVSYADSYDGDWYYRTNKFWACPHCTFLNNPPEGLFSNKKCGSDYGFEHYVKCVHEWYSDNQTCHGRVLELMTPYFEREQKRKKKEERERKIKEAKKILEEEGILGNS